LITELVFVWFPYCRLIEKKENEKGNYKKTKEKQKKKKDKYKK